MTRFDLTTLSTPPTSAEAAALRERHRAGEFGPAPSPTQKILLVTIALLGASWFLQVFTGILPQRSYWRLLVWLAYGALVAFVIVRLVRSTSRDSWMKLARLADSNGLRYTRSAAGPTYPGLLFGRDHSTATEHVWSPEGVFADVGGLTYTTGTGKSQQTHVWNFVAYRLPREVPHLVLDSKGNNSKLASNLPSRFSAPQRLSLGEPFDSHYTLYAPQAYERDTFQLLSPDAMAELLKVPDHFDLELVDSWLFLYTPYPLDLTAPNSWQFIQEVQDGLLPVLIRNLDHYQDDRVEALGGDRASNATHPQLSEDAGVPKIAGQGRRLRRGPSRSWVIVVAIGVLAVLLTGCLWYVINLVH